MTKKHEKYTHHDAEVFVRKDLKGKHSKHCLCYDCEYFTPERPDLNCSIAQEVYALCVKKCLVLPVWECPKFRARWTGSKIDIK